METKTESEVSIAVETVEAKVETVEAQVEAVEAQVETVAAKVETKRTSTKEIITYLVAKFPACFSVDGPAKPLKVGIFQELAEKLADDEVVSKTRLRQALRHYTSSWRYLKSVKLGCFRVDIDGNDAAEIDQDQADYAAKTLKESQEKFGNKKPKDKVAKKPYKGTKPESKVSNDVKNNDVKNKAKFKAVKSTNRPSQPKVEVKLKAVTSDTVAIGKHVKVKLGNSPMDAIITEVAGNDVSVQLNSGMVVKTQVKNIFTE
ncbi:MAG: ProP effector [Alteromonadaceae bacterium]|jgi:ProP effector